MEDALYNSGFCFVCKTQNETVYESKFTGLLLLVDKQNRIQVINRLEYRFIA